MEEHAHDFRPPGGDLEKMTLVAYNEAHEITGIGEDDILSTCACGAIEYLPGEPHEIVLSPVEHD